MKRFPDLRFGEILQPASFDEVIQLVVDLKNPNTPVWMWRGQSDERWQLHSAAYRRLQLNSENPTDKNVESYEVRLLSSATHRGYRHFLGRELSDFELLARLQHHGAATRLIDTTRNALIGLYFACVGSPKRSGMLFGIHCWHLGGGEGSPLAEKYRDKIKSIQEYSHPQTWEPSQVSPRVAAQHSQFVYSAVKDGAHGSLALDKLKDSLVCIRIAAAKKPEYLSILRNTFDISHLTLFPDLEGFGYINNYNHDQWSVDRW